MQLQNKKRFSIALKLANTIVFVVLLVLVYSKANCQPVASKAATSNIYAHALTNSEGIQQPLASFKGKKLWIVILPGTLIKGDSSLLERIDSIANSKAATVQTIIIPSFDKTGFISDGGAVLGKWYRQMRSHQILLAKPMAAKKGKHNTNEPDILQWLSDATLNGHFNKEIDALGTMYLLDEEGVLKGTFDFATIWNSTYLNILFQ